MSFEDDLTLKLKELISPQKINQIIALKNKHCVDKNKVKEIEK